MCLQLFVVSSKIIHICCMIFGYIVLCYALSMSQVSLSLFIRFWLPHPLNAIAWHLDSENCSETGVPGEELVKPHEVMPSCTFPPQLPRNPDTSHTPQTSSPRSGWDSSLFVFEVEGLGQRHNNSISLGWISFTWVLKGSWWILMAPYYCWLTPPFHNRSSFFVDS